MATDVYKELCSKMMVPESERMARIWSILCDETDARLVAAMPGTVPELAERTGLSEGEIDKRLKTLFYKGVVFESQKPHGTVYRGPRHIIQMHDASIQWPDAPKELYDAWKAFTAEEYPPLLSTMLASGLPSFMRVVPTTTAIEGIPDASPFEDVTRMIDAATDLAVCKCPCRVSERNCDLPTEVCIQFDRGARYNIKRGTGREISRDEALRLVREAEEAGLVHTVENRPGLGNVLCNCCTCCCAIIRPYLSGPEFHAILAPSRFCAQVAHDECIADALCADICPVEAIALDEQGSFACVDEALCIGCGLCVSVCPTGAVSMKTVRPPDYWR